MKVLTKQEWITEAFAQQERANKAEAENAYLRERHAEAVAQLPATIEVLEAYPVDGWRFELQSWYNKQAKPHLEHLKALAKEAEV